MAELLYGPTMWNRIRSQAVKVRSRKAAVAYVGTDADELIPFRDGDTVVFDGSDSALRSGATNPATIDKWLKSGTQLYSYEGLHAKVLVLGNTVVVASANLSWHSHDRLLEAAVVDQDKELRKSAVAMIGELVASSLEPVDHHWVSAARDRYRPPRGPQTGARGGTSGRPLLPPGPFGLLIGQWHTGTSFSAAEDRQDEEARALLRAQRGPARQYELFPWVLEPDDHGVREGDMWVEVGGAEVLRVDLVGHDAAGGPEALLGPDAQVDPELGRLRNHDLRGRRLGVLRGGGHRLGDRDRREAPAAGDAESPPAQRRGRARTARARPGWPAATPVAW